MEYCSPLKCASAPGKSNSNTQVQLLRSNSPNPGPTFTPFHTALPSWRASTESASLWFGCTSVCIAALRNETKTNRNKERIKIILVISSVAFVQHLCDKLGVTLVFACILTVSLSRPLAQHAKRGLACRS